MGRIDSDQAIATVRAALDAGITVLDTAEAYRRSETLVGQALRGGYREKCFLATKASRDFSPAGIRSAMENSLRALRVDHVDLYQIHGWNPLYPVEESMEEMRRLRDEGKTRYVGVSNFLPEHMERARAVCPVHSNQVRYSLLFREIEQGTIDYCGRHGIGIIVHSPLAKGLLTGRYTASSTFASDDERSGFPDFQGQLFSGHLARAEVLEAIARRKGITLVQLAIAWTLRLPEVSCTLVGARNPAQVAEHLGAAGIKFSAAEIEAIEKTLASPSV
jgi:aryl-alcohol dehydrogenase-like predicted oxidoreductase